MAKNDLKEALGASLRAEEHAMTDRFAQAESYFRTHEGRVSNTPAATPREKVIRDGFTMPAADYALITQVQTTSLHAGVFATKSEVLRAGLHALSKMSPVELQHVLQALEKVKTGRPATR
ncbi:MAG: hypothetical protein V3R80_03880 [Candidatus Tectomicrobia bacterium]